MTFQQIRYVIFTAKYGSISAASKMLYVSQPTVSSEIRRLEEELNITIFNRGKSGIVVTEEGIDFIESIRSIWEQAEFIEHKYKNADKGRYRFAIAGHHSAFISEAFIKLLETHKEDSYTFQVLEVRTKEILELVTDGICNMGILLKGMKNKVLENEIKRRNLEYKILTSVKPHVYLNERHPLAGEKTITKEALADYPFMIYDQGKDSWEYFSEEILGELKQKQVISLTDRRTETNISAATNAYTIGSGNRDSEKMIAQTVSIPMESDDEIEIIWIKRKDRKISPLMKEYLTFVCRQLKIPEDCI